MSTTLIVGQNLSIPHVLSGRLLVQANSGAGKSYLLRYILENTRDVPHIIFDLEGEYHTLAEHYPYTIIGGDHGIFEPKQDQIPEIIARTILSGASIIIDLYNHNISARQQIASSYLNAIMHQPRSLWRPFLVAIDEAHVLAPEKGHGSSAALEAVKTLCSQGRKRGIGSILATQRISKLSKDVAAEFTNKLIGRTNLDVDVKRAIDEAGFTGDLASRQKLRQLEPGLFYAIGPAFGTHESSLVTAGPIVSRHPQPGDIDYEVRPQTTLGGEIFQDLIDRSEYDGVDVQEARTASDQIISQQEAQIEQLNSQVAWLTHQLNQQPQPTKEPENPEAILFNENLIAEISETEVVITDYSELRYNEILYVLDTNGGSMESDRLRSMTGLNDKTFTNGLRWLRGQGYIQYGAFKTVQTTTKRAEAGNV